MHSNCQASTITSKKRLPRCYFHKKTHSSVRNRHHAEHRHNLQLAETVSARSQTSYEGLLLCMGPGKSGPSQYSLVTLFIIFFIYFICHYMWLVSHFVHVCIKKR